MSVYPQLLLSAGGGIVSAQQQAKQVENTATILIGLGGTGIDCLRMLKTQVYSRLEPDDPKAVIPAYQHIRFLGIDSDTTKQGNADEDEQEQGKKNKLGAMSLDTSEFFSIANPNVKAAFANPSALKIKRELDWLRWEDIPAVDLTDSGAGGIRQVGRFFMMDKSQEFMARLKDEIEMAKQGLQAPKVMIHIFAGLSGGTGSGTFLDVCYMVRSMAESIGNVTMFGYFFLPDVNLSRIPSSQVHVREYIPKNGYAAMQELDYCMQLQFNGGVFTQEYKGGKKIQWRESPVDMCHLICATDSHNNVIENAYDYAMNVTSEYVMDFLTMCAEEKFQLTEHLANFQRMVREGDGSKKIGSNLAYCIIGASCASIPLREINTYLAAELFDKFSRISRNLPTEQDVLKLAVDAFVPGGDSLGQVYDAIYQTLRANADEDFPVYPYDYKYVLEYGDKELTDHYAGLLAQKRGSMTSNAASLTDTENAQSLVRCIQTKLLDILRDVTRGPIYGYRMLAASESHNLLNLIDGLIDQNTSLLGQATYNQEDIRRNYENARRDFLSSGGLFSGAKKKYDIYLSCVTSEVQSQLTIDTYKTLEQVLRTFRSQVVAVTGEYYIKLSRVTSNLIDTFAENRSALAGGLGDAKKGAFSTPMMTIEELKPALDAQIKGLDIPNMMSAFMDKLISSPDAWIAENEYKIARLVTDFFVKEAFHEFANLTITAFLREKYHTTTDEELKNKVYSEWIQKLTAKAAPLFYFNTAIWDSSQTTHVCAISVPQTSLPIVAAAEKKQSEEKRWEVKKSALTDRIFVMGSACVLPLSSYNNCTEYEQKFFATTAMAGTHYYEGKPITGMNFCDWRKLPSLTPASIVNLASMPDEIRTRTEAAFALHEKASHYDMFDSENAILLPSEESLNAVRQVIANWETLKGTFTKPEDIVKVQQAQEELTAASTTIQMVKSEYKMRDDGYAQERSDKLRVQRDHFVEAPAYQMVVSDAVDQLDAVKDAVEKALADMQEKENKLGTGAKGMTNYFEALFSGVVSVEGMVIVYHQSEFGVTTDHILSKRDTAFPFAVIPFYQGYLNFQALSPDLQTGIQGLVNDRLNALAPEMKASCESLKTLLSDERVNSMAQQAANFAERADIMAFLKKLKQEFTLFCQSNGI